RDRRTTIGILLSLTMFIWCIGAVRSDNQRWVKNLHEGHQSEKFHNAVERLNRREGASGEFDQCSVCHERRGWVENLVSTMEPVKHTVCERCHETTPKGAETAKPPSLSTF